MASPSRSSSVARYSSLASFISTRRSLTTCAPRTVSSYVGLKPLSTSIDRPLLGRSATWPTEARTSNALPRNLEMVLAFAGDSTMTSGLAMALVSLRDGGGPCQGAPCDTDAVRRAPARAPRSLGSWIALDVDASAGTCSSDFGQPPVAVAEQLHRRRHQHHAHDGGVDEHRRRQAETEQLEAAVVAEDERREHADHDQRCGGDDPGGDGQTVGDGRRRCRRCGRTPPSSARAGTPRSPSTGRTMMANSIIGTQASIGPGLADAEQALAPSPIGRWRR